MDSYVYVGISSIFIIVGLLGLYFFAVEEAVTLLRERKARETAKEARMKSLQETICNFATGLFPAGCKFYHENGELSMGGELLAAIIVDKRHTERMVISPCEGCAYYQECEIEGRFKSKEDRLDTDNVRVRPLSEKEMEMMLQVMLGPMDDATDWAFDPDNEFDHDFKDEKIAIPWILRVIRKRIIGENLRIEITEKAYLLLMIITDGNPGKAMFVLHKIGNLFEKGRAQRWLVSSDVITSSLFPFGVPTEEAWDEWWDNQKVSRDSGKSWSDNLVDMFPAEWKKREQFSEVVSKA